MKTKNEIKLIYKNLIIKSLFEKSLEYEEYYMCNDRFVIIEPNSIFYEIEKQLYWWIFPFININVKLNSDIILSFYVFMWKKSEFSLAIRHLYKQQKIKKKKIIKEKEENDLEYLMNNLPLNEQRKRKLEKLLNI